MFEVMTVVHPDAGVVCHERDVVGLAGQHVERVDPPRASDGRHPVASQHHLVVARGDSLRAQF